MEEIVEGLLYVQGDLGLTIDQVSDILEIGNKLKEYEYIDDKEYSKRYIESVNKRQGKRLIEYKLMMKGVKKEDIESAYFDADDHADESVKLLARKHLANKAITKENIAKSSYKWNYRICYSFHFDCYLRLIILLFCLLHHPRKHKESADLRHISLRFTTNPNALWRSLRLSVASTCVKLL